MRAFGVFVGMFVLLLVFVSPAAACAAPPPGWVRVDPIEGYASMFGPTVLAFSVPAFFVLRTRRAALRWFGLLAGLGFVVVVFTTTVLLGMNCGHYAPP